MPMGSATCDNSAGHVAIILAVGSRLSYGLPDVLDRLADEALPAWTNSRLFIFRPLPDELR